MLVGVIRVIAIPELSAAGKTNEVLPEEFPCLEADDFDA